MIAGNFATSTCNKELRSQHIHFAIGPNSVRKTRFAIISMSFYNLKVSARQTILDSQSMFAKILAISKNLQNRISLRVLEAQSRTRNIPLPLNVDTNQT